MGRFSRLPYLLFSLRWRLSLVLTAAVLLSTAVCVFTAVIFLQRVLTDRATSDLQNTLNGGTAYLDRERQTLLAGAELLAADPRVPSSMTQRQNLIKELTPYYAGLNVDLLEVVDRSGHVIVNMEDTNFSGRSVLSVPDVAQALAGHEWVGLDRDAGDQIAAGGWGIRASVPLQDARGVVGAVVVGRHLDSAYAAELGRQFSADVNLIAGRTRTGSTSVSTADIPISGGPESPALLARIANRNPGITIVNEDGRTVLSGLIPLSGANRNGWTGAVEITRPLDPLYNVIRGLSLLLLAIGLCVVIGGALIALYLGRRLTQRLHRLETMASEVVEHAAEETPLRDLPHILPVQGQDEVASLARSFDAMMTALDERMETNAGLYAAAQARVNELTKLAEVARLLTAAHPIEETLDMLSSQVCRLVGCKAAALYVPAGRDTPALFGGCGLPEGYAPLISSAITQPVDEDAPLASQVAYWTGASAWRRVDTQGDRFSSVLLAADASGWGAATAVPLRLQDRTIGVVTCYTEEPAPLSGPQMSLLTTVADQVAVAVENARLYSQARDVAALQERGRLARELHDSVTQALFSMTMHTRAAQVVLDRDGPDARERLGQALDELGNLTRGALAEMRALIFELRPNALGEEGLAAALEKHSAAVSAREGLPVVVQVPDGRTPLDAMTEEHLYRLAQEALHNAVKHAHATRVHVRLACDAPGVTLEISDDGVGFDPAVVPAGHLGLQTMTDRVEQIGGFLEVRSAPGRGTTIRAAIPQPTSLRRTS